MLLYHYCSIEAFTSIMKSKSIMLSDITKSNDSTELISLLIEMKKQYVNDSDKASLDEIIDGIKTVAICWAFCLSEEGNLLSQWRGYGADGAGFSIGFDENTMNKYFPCKSNSFEIDLIKMDYTFDFSQLHNMGPNESKLFALCKSFEIKNSAFAEEQEHRIAAISTKDTFFKQKIENNLTFCNKDDNSLFTFNNSNDSQMLKFGYKPIMTSYIELPFDFIGNPVREIIIGPKNKLTVADVKAFLVSEGFLKSLFDNSIVVKKSTIPYV